ncbi:MAG: thioredoxin domain-containing protein, partial [Nitrospirae bacterium]
MNRLSNEKSPYLLQHAHNPVDWYPWSDEAFEVARREDRPIFLSIGYSTCHWCHVMERESFEDEEVAALLNRYFVSIKVDREERPDIDSLYMTVCQAMTGRGGWPMSIFMTPEKEPFLAATYIPKESRGGMKGMRELIPLIGELWKTRRKDLVDEAKRIMREVSHYYERPPHRGTGEDPVHTAEEELAKRFDHRYGGFGTVPKFPAIHNLMFLLSRWHDRKDENLFEMVLHTLDMMLSGGIYDHIGGGFHRYSTDQQWRLPHFEKMLYDQAMILYLLGDVYRSTGDRRYLRVIEEMKEFLKRDFLAPEGGFYSAWDADSEGEEGRFYTWETDEILEVLGEKEGYLFIEYFNMDREGNYLEESSGRKTGRNVLFRSAGSVKDKPPSEQIDKWRDALFRKRAERVHPLRDEKVLTDWNGLMMAGLGRAYQATGDRELLALARGVYRFIEEKMSRTDGGLFHRYFQGEADINGHLDDYAFYCFGLIELYLCTGTPDIIKRAREVMDYTLKRFRRDGGGYYLTEQERDLPIRTIEVHDAAIPSGNSMAVHNLVRLGQMFGDAEYLRLVEEDIDAVTGMLGEYTPSATFFLTAESLRRRRPTTVVIAYTVEDF